MGTRKAGGTWTEVLKTLKHQSPTQATEVLPSKTLNHQEGENQLFHGTTQIKQYISTNQDLQKVLEEINHKEVNMVMKTWRIHNLRTTNSNKRKFVWSRTHTTTTYWITGINNHCLVIFFNIKALNSLIKIHTSRMDMKRGSSPLLYPSNTPQHQG